MKLAINKKSNENTIEIQSYVTYKYLMFDQNIILSLISWIIYFV